MESRSSASGKLEEKTGSDGGRTTIIFSLAEPEVPAG